MSRLSASALDVPLQLFVGDVLDAARFQPPKNPPSPIYVPKPRGGLWTSTWLGNQYGSAWVQWCLGEDFCVPDDGMWNCTVLRPALDARVFVVDCRADLEFLVEDSTITDSIGGVYPDFEKIATRYDAIRLTKKGMRATRSPWLDSNLWGWDVESTLWLAWKFSEMVPIGHRTFSRIP